MLRGQPDELGHRLVRTDGDGVTDDAAFVLLLGPDFTGLSLDGHVLVDDSDAAFLSQRDRQPRLRHRIHGRRHERNVQANVFGQTGSEGNL